MIKSWTIVSESNTAVLTFIDLSLTKGIDDDSESRAKLFDVNSDENSCGDDSDFSDKVGIERRLIKP
jgi:hypothetical protein